MSKIAFIDTGPMHPHHNMALDEALLESHEPGSTVLRFYSWDPHALSLGYFQPYEDADQAFVRENRLVITRRATGGGAIVHAHELTYSLVADAPRGPGSSRALYAAMNSAIVSAIRSFGVEASERGTGSAAEGGAFMCFERHADFDVVVRGKKIAGSAQRRKGGAILQHGSVLLSPPPGASGSIAALSPCAGTEVRYHSFSTALSQSFSATSGMRLEASAVPDAIGARTDELVAAKYGTDSWIRRA